MFILFNNFESIDLTFSIVSTPNYFVIQIMGLFAARLPPYPVRTIFVVVWIIFFDSKLLSLDNIYCADWII